PFLVDHVDRHPPVVEASGVKELHLEGRRPVYPERAVGPEADVAPLVVADAEQPVGDLALRVAIGLRGQLARSFRDALEIELGLGDLGSLPRALLWRLALWRGASDGEHNERRHGDGRKTHHAV